MPLSKSFVDLTGDDDHVAPFRDWTSPSSQLEFEGGQLHFVYHHKAQKVNRLIKLSLITIIMGWHAFNVEFEAN